MSEVHKNAEDILLENGYEDVSCRNVQRGAENGNVL